jgi:hypothetical protein
LIVSSSESPVLRDRLARVLNKSGERGEALNTYDTLQRMGTVRVEGHPPELLARQGRCRIFEEMPDTMALHKEARQLASALYTGGWQIDRATFQVYQDNLQKWGAPVEAADMSARTEVAIGLWNLWHSGELPPRGRRIFYSARSPVLAVWSGGPEHPTAWLATVGELKAWLGPLAEREHLAVSLFDTDGQPIIGEPQAARLS